MMRIGIISGDETLHAPAVRYLSSYLKKGGHPVELLFMRKRAATTPTPHLPDDFPSYSAEQLDAARRWAGKFDLLGLTCISLNAPRTRQLAVALSGGAPVVWGGAHATTSSEECLAQSDMVCRGEGEEAFLLLVELPPSALQGQRPEVPQAQSGERGRGGQRAEATLLFAALYQFHERGRLPVHPGGGPRVQLALAGSPHSVHHAGEPAYPGPREARCVRGGWPPQSRYGHAERQRPDVASLRPAHVPGGHPQGSFPAEGLCRTHHGGVPDAVQLLL